ncbi:MAG: hypothetical protein KUG75_14205 [Pseudomonadales bacterium]|nr:hypothetical protein [Pseudomonadales bacterium]
MQKLGSSVFGTHHASARLEYQSMTAMRYTKPCAIGIYVISVDQRFRACHTYNRPVIGGTSIGSINYLANGSKAFPKERLEVFCGGGILQLNNFRALKGFGWQGFRSERLWRQDKGQKQCAQAFVDVIGSGDASGLIEVDELIEVASTCFDVVEQIT